ncbi:TIGR00266 family protein [Prosthecobacter sp.]|uniref:TIGR00266 family protein n=1 Tax=Prosthecobacter sp. TaxID=1965333 RepID=UPI0037C93D0C
MRHTVLHSPAFSTLRLDMAEGESIHAQPGSMQAMTPGFHIDVKAGLHMGGKRGMFGGMRSLFGGESFFTVIYKAKRDEQHLMLAPEQMGDIRAIEVTPDTGLKLARGAFLASSPELTFDLHNAGMQGVLATRGLFFLKTVGSGMLFLSSYGGIVEQDLAEGERFVLDNRNIVAFTDTMPFESVVLTKSIKDSFLSGEGFVVRFTGPGKVIYQTRARPSLGLIRGFLQTLT